MTVTASQRRRVRAFAGGCCEYCRLAESQAGTRFQIDHIIPLKHGGGDESANLCLACYPCNVYKGANLAGIDPFTGELTALFNPRTQDWDAHFEIESNASVTGISAEGRATVDVLRINDARRVLHRLAALSTLDYPCVADRNASVPLPPI